MHRLERWFSNLSQHRSQALPPGGLVTAQISGPRSPHSFCFGQAEHLLFYEFPARVMLPPDTTLFRAAPLESEVHSAGRTRYIFVYHEQPGAR